MLVKIFFLLRKTGVPVSITELLTLLEALKVGLGDLSAERFYYLARTCLVKDERYYDRYDKAFAAHFKGAEDLFALLQRESSGTSVEPNSTEVPMLMIMKSNWMLMLHGQAFLNAIQQSGPS